jgi:mRNA interferase YafQ
MMLVPVPSTQYGKDFRRIVQSPKFNQAAYLTVLSLLIAGKSLPAKYSNHPLSGDYAGYWDCHITNDCVLIYKIDGDELRLARIGTHSELFKK